MNALKNRLRFCLVLIVWLTFFSWKWVAAVSLAVIFHELSHLAVCRAIGIKIVDIKALPWGLTAAAPVIYEPFAQFSVSLAGPMANFFLLLFCPVAEKLFSKDAANLFALANIADGVLNLIPALPLDGGIMLKSVLCARFGIGRGFSYMIRITGAIAVAIILIGIYILTVSECNFSYLMAGIFMFFNIKHEKEIAMLIKKKILTGEIHSIRKPKKIFVSSKSHAICLIDLISPSYTLTIQVVEGKKHVGSLSQMRLIECILKNSTVTVGECIEKN